jgi:hypothetical protein
VNFDLDEDQALLKASVERFVADRYGGDIERRRCYLREPAGFSAYNWRLLGELGVLAVPFAEADGGLGGGPVELITTAEVLGDGLVVEPWLTVAVLAGGVVAAAGTDAQKAMWLPKIIAGEARLSLAQAEHEGRYALASAATTARSGRLTGRKTFVLGASGADALIVTARGDDGVGLYLLPTNANGVDIRAYRIADGSLAGELTLRDAAAEPLPGGLAALNSAVTRTLLAACGELVGLAGLLHRTTLDYARTRRQFGVPIGSFQSLQHRMVDDYAALEQARSMTYCAALAPTAQQIAGAKAFVSDAATRIAHSAVQIHGGMGMTDELLVGHALKRVMLLARLFGDASTQLRAFAKAA